MPTLSAMGPYLIIPSQKLFDVFFITNILATSLDKFGASIKP